MRIVVLGAGYAGLTLARELEDELPDAAQLVVVNDRPDHLVQHELHRVIRRPSLADEITVELDAVLDRADVRESVVTGVDTDARVIHLEAGDTIDYDIAAVCLGAETAFYGLEGVEEHATPLKRLPHAATIRDQFLAVCAAGGRVVVGGAGLSGVQVAGELAALAREEDGRMTANHDIDGAATSPDDPDGVEIVLLEQADAVAPNFPEAFQAAVAAELDERGIDVRTGTAIERATDAEIALGSGETVAYDQFVWTGGIRGPDAIGGERPVTDGSLELDSRTFVVGDAARVIDAEGAAVPASAAAAVREAHAVADNIATLAAHEVDGSGGDAVGSSASGERSDGDAVFGPRLDSFRFDAPGWLVSVGDGAVAQVGPSVFRGAAAKAVKTSVGAGYLGSVGAITNAVDLVRAELPGGSRENGESIEE